MDVFIVNNCCLFYALSKFTAVNIIFVTPQELLFKAYMHDKYGVVFSKFNAVGNN